MPYAIRLDQVFYAEATVHPWTVDEAVAKRWDSPAIPEGIVAYWNKVHYQRYETMSGKRELRTSALGFRSGRP
jgi:hypothetical protein